MHGRILVIQTAFLGDAILTLPLIQNLKKNNPGNLVDVLCIPSTRNIFKHSPHVNDVIVYDKKKKSFLKLFSIINSIRRNNYLSIYTPHRSIRTALIVYFSGIKQTFGFDTASLNSVYKNKIKYDSNIHEVARNLSLSGFDVNKDDWHILPEIKIPDDVVNKIDKLINASGRQLIALAPGSVWDTKIYPKEYYLEICNYLISSNYKVGLIGNDEDKLLCEEIAGRCKSGCVSFAGSLTIIESIALLKKSVLLICNDSAPTHMAMAADIPVLTIYCSTVPRFGFYPYNRRSDTISFDELTCKPCGIHGHKKCPIESFDCGVNLKPSIVIDKLNSILTSEKN